MHLHKRGFAGRWFLTSSVRRFNQLAFRPKLLPSLNSYQCSKIAFKCERSRVSL